MIPAQFDYVEATSVADAIRLLAEHGDEAKLLAGGHSLIPLMKLRLVTPATLIDVTHIKELSYIKEDGSNIVIGALTRHRDIEESDLVKKHLPLVAHVAGEVGDPQVRNRGTIGGSLVHGDPAADLPAAVLATGATMVIAGKNGERRISAQDFFVDFLETDVQPGEILVAIEFPKHTDAGWAYEKFVRRAMDYSIVGVALQLGAKPGVALVNMSNKPHLAVSASQAIGKGAAIADVLAVINDNTNPPEDLNATVEYRQHLARVLTQRAFATASK